MAQISIIQKSELKGAARIDSEYYKPEYLKKDKILKQVNCKKLEDISKSIINFGAYSLCSQIEYLGKGVPFLQVSNIKENFVTGNFKYINEELSTGILYKSLVRENQVLISIAGTIGNTVVAQGLPRNTNSNQAIANITLKDEINPFYVSTFLNSIFGKYQSQRLIISNVQPNLLLTQVKSIKIPIFPHSFQLEIEKIVKQAHQKQSRAKDLYAEAEKLLLTELNLLDYQPKHQLCFSTNKKDIEQAQRFDAEYFQPKYADIMQKIENYAGGFDVVKNQFNQNVALSKKNQSFYNYIEISDINTSNGEIIHSKRLLEDVPANGKRKLYKNDLLISKVRPYRGAISFIDFEVDNLLGSGAFVVLQEKTEYKKEVLMMFLKTVFIKELLLRYNCGTSYPVIKDEDILNLKIPLIKPEIQQKIANKIIKSHKLRTESKNLLEKAKKAVEQKIESA